MKKLTIKAMATIVVILTVVALTFSPNLYAGDNPSDLNPDPEAGAGGGTQCISTPTSNVGTCKKNVGGPGNSCVTAGWFDSKNCSSHQ